MSYTDRKKASDARYRDANREKRRAYDRERHKALRQPCPNCGQLRKPAAKLCKDCFQAEHERKLDLVERLYNEGVSVKEIAVALGYGKRSLPGILLDELRKAGRIGYRYKGYEALSDTST